jgi:uncharacterized RDD family membrane protein YckC
MSLDLLELDDSGHGSGSRSLEGVGVLRRGVARLLDTAICVAIAFVAALLAFLLASLWIDVLGPPAWAALERLLDAAATEKGLLGWGIEGLIGLGAFVALHSLSEGLHGSTIGKRLLGLTVVAADGSPAGLGAGIIRSLGFLIDQLAFGLVGAWRIDQSPRAQRIGDEWADTLVVRIAALPPGARRSTSRFVVATLAGVLAAGIVVVAIVSAWIVYEARLSAEDRVAIAAAVQEPAAPFRAGDTVTFLVRVQHNLRSARTGQLRLFSLDEGVSLVGEQRIPAGLGLTTLVAPLKIPEYRPGYSQPGGLRLEVALFPARNERTPSARHEFELRIAPCGLKAGGEPTGDLCTE